MTDPFKVYFDAVKGLDIKDATEHTLRGALENLLNAIARARNTDIKIIHEPKKDKSGKGAPDFKFKVNEAILGYLENKKIGEDLDQILKSAQIAKYKQLSGNIIITNYLEWVWLRDGNILARETLCYQSDVGNRRAKLDPEKAEKVGKLIEHFYSIPPKEIGRAKDLALALATRCHDLRDVLLEELLRQKDGHQQGRLWGLYGVFQRDVFNALEVGEFADAFAQTLAYGLFLARLNMQGKPDKITLDNAKKYIPVSFELIRELVSFLDELEKEQYLLAKQPVDEILSIMNTLDLPAIHEDLTFTQGQDKLSKETEEEHQLFAKDPYVYFYEDFLKHYDAATRKSRGVYYTPPPVVNFIIRATNNILKDTFGISKGLADRKQVTVLDFATGTGTFLIEILQQILEDVSEGIRDQIIEQHVLKNLYGFEYLIAPYTIAHLKLSQFLHDKGYKMKGEERLQIYMTNTLEPISPQMNLFLPALSKEVKQAQEIKDKPILVITGNPPYNRKSRNNGKGILELLQLYKPDDESNIQPLNDDYIKFIRFAHAKIEKASHGIVGVITNNTFLNGLIHRKMRNELINAFSEIYVINLHGSSFLGRYTDYYKNDENVFDIKQGVSITLLVKKQTNEHKSKGKVYYSELLGSRLSKYRRLMDFQISSPEFVNVDYEGFDAQFRETRWGKRFTDPLSFFIPNNNLGVLKEYGDFIGIGDIFGLYRSGIQTGKDDLFIQLEHSTAEAISVDMKKLSPADFIAKYDIKLSSGWSLSSKLKNVKPVISEVLYRPFDSRYIVYSTALRRSFYEVMKHLLDKDNIALTLPRQIALETYQHVLCTDKIAEVCSVSSETKENHYVFPLYQYKVLNEGIPTASLFEEADPFGGKDRIENFTPTFRKFIDDKYGKYYSPEQIIGYIYAVLHSPTYRSKYIEFLKIDFPRIPFADDTKIFEDLSKLGWQLMQAHLLKEVPVTSRVDITKGSGLVEKMVYDESEQRLYISKGQYFSPVPKDVWEFRIGNYQVLDKYLKSRKGRKLTLDEIENIQDVVKVLTFTITRMQKIDEIWKP